jgi:hypothetical protein
VQLACEFEESSTIDVELSEHLMTRSHSVNCALHGTHSRTQERFTSNSRSAPSSQCPETSEVTLKNVRSGENGLPK